MFDDVEKIDAQVAPLAALLDDGEIIVGHVAPIAALLDAFGLQSSQVVRLREQHDLQKNLRGSSLAQAICPANEHPRTAFLRLS